MPCVAEEWYIPRQTLADARGKGEVGTRLQFFIDRNGIEFDRGADAIAFIRYKPAKRWELYMEGPYSYREHERAVFPALLHSTDEEGWGDLYAQVSYNLAGAEDWSLTFSTDGVFPTGKNPYVDNRTLGEGQYQVTPGLTYVKVLDPAALFFYAGHQWTIPRVFPTIGKVEPGEDFRFRFGISVALHPRLHASLYTAGDIIGHTRFRSIQSAGSDRDIVRMGGSFDVMMTDRVKANINTVFGVTDNATDAVYSFGLSRLF